MATTHSTATRNGIADYVVDLLDSGTTDTEGDMFITTSGDAEVATCPLSNPAFGAASAGVATANAITDDSDAAGGTAAKVKMRDRDNTVIFEGTVTATGGGGDLELSSVSIGAGDTVSISSATYTAPS